MGLFFLRRALYGWRDWVELQGHAVLVGYFEVGGWNVSDWHSWRFLLGFLADLFTDSLLYLFLQHFVIVDSRLAKLRRPPRLVGNPIGRFRFVLVLHLLNADPTDFVLNSRPFRISHAGWLRQLFLLVLKRFKLVDLLG